MRENIVPPLAMWNPHIMVHVVDTCVLQLYFYESFVYFLARFLCLNNCGNNTMQLYLEIGFWFTCRMYSFVLLFKAALFIIKKMSILLECTLCSDKISWSFSDAKIKALKTWEWCQLNIIRDCNSWGWRCYSLPWYKNKPVCLAGRLTPELFLKLITSYSVK